MICFSKVRVCKLCMLPFCDQAGVEGGLLKGLVACSFGGKFAAAVKELSSNIYTLQCGVGNF